MALAVIASRSLDGLAAPEVTVEVHHLVSNNGVHTKVCPPGVFFKTVGKFLGRLRRSIHQRDRPWPIGLND